MRICIFGEPSSVHLQQLAGGLVRRGMDIHIVCHKPGSVPGATIEQFQVPGAGLANPRRWSQRRAHYLRGILRRFDAVNIQFLADWGFTPEVLRSGCVVATPWGSDVVPPPGEPLPSAVLSAARKSLLRHAQAISAWGPSFAATVAQFVDIDPQRVTVLPLGVDVELFKPAARCLTTDSMAYRVGFYKGFRPVYGPVHLIRAIPRVLEELPTTRFDLIGDGPELARCRKVAENLGVTSSIEWIPRQPHHRIPNWLARWDLTVVPSECEAFGVAALESAAMGVPVVASNVGGLPDAVRDGVTGMLVPPQCPEALARAIVSLLKDAARRQAMSEAGQVWVRDHFDWNRVLDQWEAMFCRVAENASIMV